MSLTYGALMTIMAIETMKHEVSIAEAKASFSSLINAVAYGGHRILVLSRGKPKAALVGVEDLKRLEGGLVASTRAEALKRAETLRKKIASRKKKIASIDDELAALREGRVR